MLLSKNKKLNRRSKIRMSIRRKLRGSTEKPRLSIYKSNRYIYVQIIDDTKGHTLLGLSSLFFETKNVNLNASRSLGELVATKALDLGIQSVVFDRSGYKYHGNIKALADSARDKGLKF